MKRLATLLLAAFLPMVPAALASGQTTIALTGGPNIASIDVGSDTEFVPDFRAVTRISVGIAANVPMSEHLGLQFGGSYSPKGGRAEVNEGGLSGESLAEFSYLEFSALGKVRFPLRDDRLSAHLLAGPALALETSCQVTFSSGVAFDGTMMEFSEDCDGAELDRSTYDLGLAVGGGLEIGPMERLGVSLGVLYTHGLPDIDKSTGSSLKHRVFTIRVGLLYSIG